MITNKKTIFQRFKYGIKSGWEMPILPNHIIELDKNIYIRMLKITGPLTIFISISGLSIQLNNIIFYIIFMISLLYIFYKYIIAYYAVKQWFHSLLTGKFIVRNSPIDIFSTMIRCSIAGIKSVGKVSIGTGMTYALCHELDDLLVKDGKAPYFVPRLRTTIQQVGLENSIKTFLTSIGITDMAKPESVTSFHDKFRELNDNDKTEFESNTGVSYNDGLKMLDYIEKNSTVNNIVIESPLESSELTSTLIQNQVIELLNYNLLLHFVMIYLIIMCIFIFTVKLITDNNISIEFIKTLPLGKYIYIIINKILSV